MPKVRLRWNDGREQEFAATGPTLAAALVLPDPHGGVASFRLVNDPDPPDLDGLPVYEERSRSA